MSPDPDQRAEAAVTAAQDLARLNARVDAMRAVLVRLLQDVVVAEKRLGNGGGAPLLEVNEQLVVSALLSQVDAEAVSRVLAETQTSAGLDPLTQLPARMLLLDRLSRALALAKRHGSRLGVLFVDIDKFKEINDTLGHAAGDEALQFVAQCLSTAVRAADTVSRYGGDEFVVLLAEVSNVGDAEVVANKVLRLLSVPGSLGGRVSGLSASIGISIFPEDGDDAHTLIGRADTAMYRAKRRGSGMCVFRAEPFEEPSDLANAARMTSPVLAQMAEPDHGRHEDQLREANEQLVLAALSAQELQDAMVEAQRRQVEFLTLMASELSDPLAPIRLAAAQLGRVPSDIALLPVAQALIERQSERMTRLVNDLLEMSRGNTGKLRFKREQIDLRDVLELAVDAIAPAVASRSQSLSVDIPPHSLLLHGNAAHLKQVFGNLLGNASRYTPHGGQINLEATSTGDEIVVVVSDNGQGMTDESVLSAFEPFTQDARGIGARGVGLGIGLTAVKELVQAHGGSVVASSAGRGLGSRFVVTLPVSLE